MVLHCRPDTHSIPFFHGADVLGRNPRKKNIAHLIPKLATPTPAGIAWDQTMTMTKYTTLGRLPALRVYCSSLQCLYENCQPQHQSLDTSQAPQLKADEVSLQVLLADDLCLFMVIIPAGANFTLIFFIRWFIFFPATLWVAAVAVTATFVMIWWQGFWRQSSFSVWRFMVVTSFSSRNVLKKFPKEAILLEMMGWQYSAEIKAAAQSARPGLT